MRRKYLLKNLLVIALVTLLFDNFIRLNHFSLKTSSFNFGTNCDITNGAISNLKDLSYVFIFSNNEKFFNGNGKDKILLKAREDINYGFFSFIPFYKILEPKITFDCYIENSNKYIGKVVVAKKITMSGFFTRKNMKNYITNDYIDEATKILNNKAIAYVDFMREPPFQNLGNYSQTPNDMVQAKIMVCLSAPREGFARNIPIREKGETYLDTIHYSKVEENVRYPLFETYKIDKPQKKIFYTSYNSNKQIIFQKEFELEKVYEDKDMYHFYTAQKIE